MSSINTPATILRHIIHIVRRLDNDHTARFRVSVGDGELLHFRVEPKSDDRLTFHMTHVCGKGRFVTLDAVFSGDRTGFEWLLNLLEAHRAHGPIPSIAIVPKFRKLPKKLEAEIHA